MNGTVVLIDDDVDLLHLLTKQLERAGFRTRTFATAHEALDFLTATSEPVASVCLDLGLPDGNGFDVCARLKAGRRTRSIPVVIMSARIELADEARATEAGADAFVTKPFRTSAFLSELSELAKRAPRMIPEVEQ